jgi:ParB-like chromosome segregation protein Spo0J
MVTSTPWRNRILGHGEEVPDQLLANPRNWRIHPKAQQDALSGVLDEVGWVQDVIVNQQTGFVVDGHLRVSLAISRGESKIPVVYVDLTSDEEALILATLDPLSAMAASAKDALESLLAEVSTGDDAVKGMLEDVAKGAGLNGAKEGLTDPDALPEAVEPVAKRGDVWLLV